MLLLSCLVLNLHNVLPVLIITSGLYVAVPTSVCFSQLYLTLCAEGYG